MKCPKCDYVGFEESVRCRHCGYDFSLTAPAAALPLHPAPAGPSSAVDQFFVDPTPTDRLGVVALHDDPVAPLPDLPLAAAPLTAPPTPEERRRERLLATLQDTPPPARPPLAVRRNAERPRSRPTTQIIRRSPASLLDAAPAADAVPAPAADREPGPPQAAGLLVRAAAGLIDLALLAGIALAVVYFTVRLSGLAMADLALLPPVPLGAFLLGQAVGYLTAFTACGGQTLGKMALGVRVVAEDGAVPPGAAVMRAFTAVAGVALAGLGLLPALFDGDHRGLHDRVAGTRVVRA